MLECFYPDEWIDSAWNIDYEGLRDQGYRGLIFDIDNTLALDGGPPLPQTLDLFAKLHDLGLAACLLSNNQESRVKSFADEIGASYICKANKPSRRGYAQAMELMGTDTDTTVSIGDQLFTDVWGAQRCGIHSILVLPIDPHEEFQIILKRFPERFILHFYRKRGGAVKYG